MDAGEIVAAMVGMLAGVGMFGGAAVWLNRYAGRYYGGVVPTLPQAKIHDGRAFGKPRPVGRNRPALAVLRFYVVLFWIIAIGGFIGGMIGIGVEVTDDNGESYHRALERVHPDRTSDATP